MLCRSWYMVKVPTPMDFQPANILSAPQDGSNLNGMFLTQVPGQTYLGDPNVELFPHPTCTDSEEINTLVTGSLARFFGFSAA